MKLLRLLAPCLLAISMAAPASADCGSIALSYLYGYGGYNATIANVPPPPYFAVHPPVYYGQRYSRPYGASPYAAWPQLQSNPAYQPAAQPNRAHTLPVAPVVVEAIPGVVHNAKKPVTPLVIDNPYFEEAVAKFTSVND